MLERQHERPDAYCCGDGAEGYRHLSKPEHQAASGGAEKNAKLAQLKADENAQAAKGGGPKVANQAALTDLAKKHGDETLKQIEAKCDPALDPTCK